MAIASGGGHWVQLLRLRPAYIDSNVFFVSLDPTSASDVPDHRYYVISEASRKQKLQFIRVILQLLRILWKERPDVIITTGSAPALMALGLGKKLFRCKTIWIDSIANAERLSTSGSQAGRVADVWLTQWEHLADDEKGPHYWGAVL
ncbi:hypothetical protein BFP76_10960 [Amylibacter kogurei]|uniref:UDP-N-acetylglucosamine--LPS N-acetylglucosamine transferase n=2 Tax=Paramylibacter TaxID=3143987 RepID=A0A2G5KB78_9RHOB|nr:hypothetical protein BFP76_10960 [Amylibacter kogurei]